MSDKRKLKRFRNSSEESDSSSESSSLTSSSDEETDAKDLKPIKEYLTNRKELASQLFKSVKAEKIKMMLPQILKRIEFSDLEELCANELIGMSRRRIMSVINGQEMLQSSDTEDTDDSGPSLEIISDTEWLSDDETTVKVEGANLKNKDGRKSNKKQDPKSKPKPKMRGKDGKPNVKVKMEKIKTEAKDKPKEKEKEKEGESLLDLLELEMRARAIRALIRKEEDPSKKSQVNNSTNAASRSTDINSKSRQTSLKEQLEKIDVLMKHGDDEDVYVVINPAPTIELLSSDEEKEKEAKDKSENVINQLISDQPSTSKAANEDKIVDKPPEKEKEPEKKIGKNVSNLPMSVIEDESNEKLEKPTEQQELEEGEILDDEEDAKKKGVEEESPKKKIKKSKKNSHIRVRKIDEDEHSENEIQTNVPIEIKESPERETRERKLSSSSKIDDDKALDIEEIINLDDYPDDETDIELQKTETIEKDKNVIGKPSGSETWASRYVQQDEVQNVIKESKIQSEIRKRLRERQRQSKLNNSPSNKEQEKLPEPEVPKPTGSVGEYLALKSIIPDTKIEEYNTETVNQVITQTAVVIVKKPQLIAAKKPEIREGKLENAEISEEKSKITEEKLLSQETNENKSQVETVIQENVEINPQLKQDAVDNCQPVKENSKLMSKNEECLKEGTSSLSRVNEQVPDSDAEKENIELVSQNKENLKKESLPLKEDEPAPGSDSSDDNVIIKIDNSTWNSIKTEIVEETSKINTNETQTPELRPD